MAGETVRQFVSGGRRKLRIAGTHYTDRRKKNRGAGAVLGLLGRLVTFSAKTSRCVIYGRGNGQESKGRKSREKKIRTNEKEGAAAMFTDKE